MPSSHRVQLYRRYAAALAQKTKLNRHLQRMGQALRGCAVCPSSTLVQQGPSMQYKARSSLNPWFFALLHCCFAACRPLVVC